MRSRAWAKSLVLTLGALCAVGVSAEVYKSVDENGRVVFSQKPPKEGTAEVIKPRYSKPPTPAAGAAAPFVPPVQPGAAPSATAAPGKPRELTPEQQAAKQKNCENAQQRLGQLQHPGPRRMQYQNEKGELAYLTPDLLEERIQEAQKKIVENCEGDAAQGSAARQ